MICFPRICTLCCAVVILMALNTFSLASEKLAERQECAIGGRTAKIMSLDPHRCTDSNSMGILANMFNALVRFKPCRLSPELIEPDLAETWKVSDDGLVWTFRIRKGVKFHHGYGELTAEDIVFSLNKAGNPKTSAFPGMLENVEKVEALDAYTVRITLRSANPDFIGSIADYKSGFIISKKAFEKLGAVDFSLKSIGTGPFQFQNHVPFKELVLGRHEDYFRGKPILQKIRFVFMPEASSRLAAYRRGELDMIDGIREGPWVKEVGTIRDTEILTIEPATAATLHFNMLMKPVDDIRVRKAIAYAIDRQVVVDSVGREVAKPLYSVVPPNYLGGLRREQIPDLLLYAYNPKKSKELLAEAGYPTGLKINIRMSNEAGYKSNILVIQDLLRRVGIDLDVTFIDHTAYHSLMRKGVNPVVLYKPARFPSANTILTNFFHSQSIVTSPTAVENFSLYKGVDELIDKARIERDMVKQKDLWRRAQLKILEDVPSYPIFLHSLVYVKRAWVKLGYELEGTLNYQPPFDEKTKILHH